LIDGPRDIHGILVNFIRISGHNPLKAQSIAAIARIGLEKRPCWFLASLFIETPTGDYGFSWAVPSRTEIRIQYPKKSNSSKIATFIKLLPASLTRYRRQVGARDIADTREARHETVGSAASSFPAVKTAPAPSGCVGAGYRNRRHLLSAPPGQASRLKEQHTILKRA
jgi:hypothetical protein